MATFPDPDPAPAPAPAPDVCTSETGVQTIASAPSPPSGSLTWRPWAPDSAADAACADGAAAVGAGVDGDGADGFAARAAGAAPVDEVGLFSISEPTAADTTSVSHSSPVSGVSSGSGRSVSGVSSGSCRSVSGVSSGSGRSVSGVHTGVTVYSCGGGSVETTASTGARPQLLRHIHSEPTGRPRPRPRRQLTGVEEPDHSCVLVMTERLEAELEPLVGAGVDGATGAGGVSGAGEGSADDLLVSVDKQEVDGGVSLPLETPAVASADSDASPPSAGPESVQERQEQGQETVQDQGPPVTEAQWRASEPPMPPPPPPAQPVDAQVSEYINIYPRSAMSS